MKHSIYVLTLFIVCLSFAIFAYAGTDAVTGATPPYDSNTPVALPQPSDTYEVLGVLPGLKSFAVRYDKMFVRGGEPYAEAGFAKLKELGIRTIVSVTPSDNEKKLAEQYGFRFIEVPFDKNVGLPTADLTRLLALFKDAAAAPFYVHCHGGTHRGGIIGVAYRVHHQGWTWENALAEYEKLGGSLVEDKIMIESVRKRP